MTVCRMGVDEVYSVYCSISDNELKLIPMNKFDRLSRQNIGGFGRDNLNVGIDKVKIRNKNLLYNLNNPSLSDFESDNLSTGSEAGDMGSGAGEEGTEMVSSIDHANTHSIYFPKFVIDLAETLNTDFQRIKEFLISISPGWTDVDKILIKQLTGGITNMLLSCSYRDTDETRLIRVYGQGTNLIIDRHREFISHLILNSLNLAPPIYSRFKNGLIYGFLPGRSLTAPELSNRNLYPLIAQQLGNWHSKLDSKAIELGVSKLRNFSVSLRKSEKGRTKEYKKKFISNIWELIEDWIEISPIVPELIASFQENLDVEVTKENMRDVIKQEFSWLKKKLTSSDSPTVTSHCDLLSGNIIIPDTMSIDETFKRLPPINDNPIQFIDYEYMLPAPRAFDIANHLAEWQGFNCDKSAIPKPTSENLVIVKWVKCYLNNEDADEREVNGLINEISDFFGLPGFYWGIWAMIQSEISNIDFDYSKYGKLRLEEYWGWKKINT